MSTALDTIKLGTYFFMDLLFPASYPNLLAELCATAEGHKTYYREDSEYCFLLLLNYRKLGLPCNIEHIPRALTLMLICNI